MFRITLVASCLAWLSLSPLVCHPCAYGQTPAAGENLGNVTVRGDAAWRRNSQMAWQPIRSGDRLELPAELVTFLESELRYVSERGTVQLDSMTRATLSNDAQELALETGGVQVSGQPVGWIREQRSVRTTLQSELAKVAIEGSVDVSVTSARGGGFEVVVRQGDLEQLSESAVGAVQFVDEVGSDLRDSPGRRPTKQPYVSRVAGTLSLEETTALLQWDIWFHNPTGSTAEGVWEFTLPPNAAITACGMFVDDTTLMHGEIVERKRARQVYDSIVRRRRDPALLEELGDGRYRLSVFPISAVGMKRVLIDVRVGLEPQGSGSRLELPLPIGDSQPADGLSLEVQDAASSSQQTTRRLASSTHSLIHEERVDADSFEVATWYRCEELLGSDSIVLLLDQSPMSVYGDADSFVWENQPGEFEPVAERSFGAMRVGLGERADEAAQELGVANQRHRHMVLMCTGGSVYARQSTRELTGMLLEALPEDDLRRVGCFDSSVRWLEDWRAVTGESTAEAIAAVEQEYFIGATDLTSCLLDALDQFQGDGDGAIPVIWVIGTPGEADRLEDSPEVWDSLKERLNETGTRLFVIQTSSRDDYQALGKVSRQVGGFHWDLTRKAGRSELFRGLMVGLETSRLGWLAGDSNTVWSQWLEADDWSGQGLLLWGASRLAEDELTRQRVLWRPSWPPEATASAIDLAGERSDRAAIGMAPLVIYQELQQRDVEWRSEGRKDEEGYAQAVTLARRWHVVSPFTTQLVLETEADYVGRDIARTVFSQRPGIAGALDWDNGIVLQHPETMRHRSWEAQLAFLRENLDESLPLLYQPVELQGVIGLLRHDLAHWSNLDPKAAETLLEFEAWLKVEPIVERKTSSTSLRKVERLDLPGPISHEDFWQLGWLPDYRAQSRWLDSPFGQPITGLPLRPERGQLLSRIMEQASEGGSVHFPFPEGWDPDQEALMGYLGDFSPWQWLRWELDDQYSWNPDLGLISRSELAYPEIYDLGAFFSDHRDPVSFAGYLRSYAAWRIASEAAVKKSLDRTYRFQLDADSFDEWMAEFHRTTGLKLIYRNTWELFGIELPRVSGSASARRVLDGLRHASDGYVDYIIMEDAVVIREEAMTTMLVPVSDLVPIISTERWEVERGLPYSFAPYWGYGGMGGGGFGGMGGGGFGGGGFGGGLAAGRKEAGPRDDYSQSRGGSVEADESMEWEPSVVVEARGSGAEGRAAGVSEPGAALSGVGDEGQPEVGEYSPGLKLSVRHWFDSDSLVDMIKRVVFPDQWDELGGSFRVVFDPGSGSLAVFTSESGVNEIEGFLDDLRQIPRGSDHLYFDQVESSSRHLVQDLNEETLQELLEQSVEPDSWEELGGIGRKEWFPGRNALSVFQEFQTQLDVATQLERLKRARMKLRLGMDPYREVPAERGSDPVLVDWSSEADSGLVRFVEAGLSAALMSASEEPVAEVDWPLVLGDGEFRVTLSRVDEVSEPRRATELDRFDMRLTDDEFWLATSDLEAVVRPSEVLLVDSESGLTERGRWRAEALTAWVDQLPWLPHLSSEVKGEMFERLASSSADDLRQTYRLNRADLSEPMILWRWTPVSGEVDAWKLEILRNDTVLATYELRRPDSDHLIVAQVNAEGEPLVTWDVVRKEASEGLAESFDERFAALPCIDWITDVPSRTVLANGVWALRTDRSDDWLSQVLTFKSPKDVDWSTAWLIALALNQRDPSNQAAQRPWVVAVLGLRPDLDMALARSLQAPRFIRQVLIDESIVDERSDEFWLRVARLSDAGEDVGAAFWAYSEAALLGDWLEWSDEDELRFLALMLSNDRGDLFDVRVLDWYAVEPGDVRYGAIDALLAEAKDWERQAAWIVDHVDDSGLSRQVVQQTLLNAHQVEAAKLIPALAAEVERVPDSPLADEMLERIRWLVGTSYLLINDPNWDEWIVDKELRAQLDRQYVLMVSDPQRVVAVLGELPRRSLSQEEFEHLVGAYASLGNNEEAADRVEAWLRRDQVVSVELTTIVALCFKSLGREETARRFGSAATLRNSGRRGW